MLVLYIAGLVIGCVLLAIAMWRRRAVPRWAAVAVGAFPIVGLVLAPAGAALAVAGFGVCALTLRRPGANPSPAANTWSGGLEQRAIVGMEDVSAPSA